MKTTSASETDAQANPLPSQKVPCKPKDDDLDSHPFTSQMASSSTNDQEIASAPEESSFPFLRLPAEIRNKIYRLVLLVHGHLRICTLKPWEYKQRKSRGSFVHRRVYRRATHIYRRATHVCRNQQVIVPASYALDKLTKDLDWSTSMLQVNRQIRNEGIVIFYGLNTFNFSDPSVIVPFLLDQTYEAIQALDDVVLTLYKSNGGICRETPTERFRGPNAIDLEDDLALLVEEGCFRPRKLFVYIQGYLLDECALAQNARWESQAIMEYVSSLIPGEKTLEMFGLGHEKPRDIGIVQRSNDVILAMEILWSTLAPRMMRPGVEKEHTAELLQQRRIPIDYAEEEYDLDDPNYFPYPAEGDESDVDTVWGQGGPWEVLSDDSSGSL